MMGFIQSYINPIRSKYIIFPMKLPSCGCGILPHFQTAPYPVKEPQKSEGPVGPGPEPMEFSAMKSRIIRSNHTSNCGSMKKFYLRHRSHGS